MTNVQHQIKDNILTIAVDLSQTFGRSKSGKSVTIASTGGNVQIAPGVYLGVNVYQTA